MIEDDITIEDLEDEDNFLKLTELPDEILLRIFHIWQRQKFSKKWPWFAVNFIEYPKIQVW